MIKNLCYSLRYLSMEVTVLNVKNYKGNFIVLLSLVLRKKIQCRNRCNHSFLE